MNVGMTTFGGDGGRSGISQYIRQLLHQFVHLPEIQPLDVYTFEDEKHIFSPEGGDIHNLSFTKLIRHPVANIAWHQLGLSRWVRRRKHDVLFLPAGNRRLPATCPCPTVGTVHDFSSLRVAGKYDWSRSLYIRCVLPMLVRKLDRVLTVSESSKRDIVEFANVPEEKVVVTPLAVNHDQYFVRDRALCRAEVVNRYQLTRPYFLYVSRIEHPGKNHVALIEAFARLKSRHHLPHQLVLAGGDWCGAGEVHQFAESVRCRDDIIFTGFAPDEDLPYLYGAADMFLFPSLYEGFGLPVLEAMACGTPTACSNTSSLPEVAGEAALQFDPTDTESIKQVMEDFLFDESRRAAYVKRGLARASQFHWKHTAKRTAQVLQEVAL